MSAANQYETRVSEKYYLTENEKFLLVKLELVKPNRIEFDAGQYVSIKINEQGERRSYSIASTPDVNHAITLVAEIIENGKGSEFLGNIPVGAEVEVMGPLGRFTVPQCHSDTCKRLFVATGSGIVPIKSMIEDLLINRKVTTPIRLHWGMRSESDLFWFDNFERLTEEHPNFVFDQVLSKPSEEWSLCTGHVQDCLGRDFTSEGSVQVLSEGWEAYICGHPERVESISQKLVEMGMDESKINHEKFA